MKLFVTVLPCERLQKKAQVTDSKSRKKRCCENLLVLLLKEWPRQVSEGSKNITNTTFRPLQRQIMTPGRKFNPLSFMVTTEN